MADFEFNQEVDPTPAPEPAPAEEGKPAFLSSTIWGAVIAVLGVLAPEVAPELTPFIAKGIVIFGALLAAFGRLRATKSITSFFTKSF